MPRNKQAGKSIKKVNVEGQVSPVTMGVSSVASKKSSPADGGIKQRKYKFKQGTIALREIKKY